MLSIQSCFPVDSSSLSFSSKFYPILYIYRNIDIYKNIFCIILYPPSVLFFWRLLFGLYIFIDIYKNRKLIFYKNIYIFGV